MLRLAVCDDNPQELHQAKKMLQDYLEAHPRLAGRIFSFTSPAELLCRAAEHGSFDVYLLDVLMPEMSGIELGRKLRAQGDTGQIIYLTTSPDYAVDSYDTGAFYYLLKPVRTEKITDVLDKAIQNIHEKEAEGITVHTHSGVCRVDFDEILFVEQQDRMMHYHLADGSTVVSCVLRKSFAAEATPLLADERFLACGSSFVLNLSRIKNITRGNAFFTTGESVLLPVTLQHTAKKKWMEYWLEREALA